MKLLRVRPIDLMLVLAIVGYVGWKTANRAPQADGAAQGATFAGKVDLSPLHTTAVQADGRLRSFESHAKHYMAFVTGPRSFQGQSNGFTYLDLIFRPERYTDADSIYVKNKLVRNQIISALANHPEVDATRAETIRKSGLIARSLLEAPAVRGLLDRLGRDLIRTGKAVDRINSSMVVSNSGFLLNELRVVVPTDANAETQWVALARFLGPQGMPADSAHASMAPQPVAGVHETLQKTIRSTWSSLRSAWRSEDVAKSNEQLVTLAGLLNDSPSELYPSSGRLAMESWYFRNKSMTWVWLLYLAGTLPLLMSVIYKWNRARAIGMVLFFVAFAFHTASVGLRWYISGRWPNSNMFEAVTTSAWFGGVGALILEWVARKTAFRNLFALGSGVMSMVALMAAYFLPTGLDSSISNKMAALNDVWLYIHTNVIIASYAVIGLACVPALLLLRHRWCLAWDQLAIPKMRLLILPVALCVLNYTGWLLLMHVLDYAHRALSGNTLIGVVGAFWGSLMIVLLELLAVKARVAAGAPVERAASGGASSLILGSPGSFLQPDKPTSGEVYDGATMVLVEVAFIMLWTGTVMGAVWADHSWGRPWGWDPKEVFALNTFIIFIILIHVRMKVRDKAFWTAVIAVIGFEVMMFNWIVVNFVITGLHSYA